MKIPQSKGRRREQGYLLLITVIFALLLGLTVASYLLVVNQEDLTVVRSKCWNSSLALAEAGVDEALANMNASPNNFAYNTGWTKSTNGTTYGPVTRTLANGSYSVYIDTSGTTPAIYSTGYVPVPDTSTNVSRRVKVTTTQSSVTPFSVGLGAIGSINFNGNGIAADSWDSSTNSESTNGAYNGYVGTNGSVASVGGLVNIGNHTIDGNLYLGPTATYAGGGTIVGTVYYDYNIQFPDATLPTTDSNGNGVSWQAAPVTNTGTVKNPVNVHDFTSANSPGTNNYYLVTDSTPIVVEPGVTVTVQVTNVANYSPASITLNGGTTNSGTLIMYDDAGSATLGGNSGGGAIGNRPENFIFFGLPGVIGITLGGTSTFIGAVYAPEASLTLNGGGSGNNLEGAAIVKNVTLNGHYNFHYDQSLANWTFGPGRGYIPLSWQEI